jgi:hypothetical protein
MTGHVSVSAAIRAAAMAAAVACLLAGCMSQAPPAPAPSSGLPSSGLPSSGASPAAASLRGAPVTWMLTRTALAELIADPAIRSGLAGSLVYEVLQPGQQPLAGFDAAVTVAFPSLTGLSHALAGGRLPAGTRAVLYDPEAWSFTPAAEQRDPVQAAAHAAGLARAHGLRLIVAPALNLTTMLARGSSEPRWRQFLDLRLAARMAKVADAIELQAQSLERDSGAYATFVGEAAAQARAANPGVTILAGLSTNPPGAFVPSDQLVAAIDASRASVDGYWLNIPDPGSRCPTCNQKRPDVGIEALRAVL